MTKQKYSYNRLQNLIYYYIYSKSIGSPLSYHLDHTPYVQILNRRGVLRIMKYKYRHINQT